MPSVQAYAILRNVPIFREMDNIHLNLIAENAHFIDLEKGQFLFHKGDYCKGFYIGVRGNVKLSFISMEGKEHVLRIVGPGQSFAEAGAFLERPYPASVQALSSARVLFIPKEIIFQCIEEDPACAHSMMAGLSRRLHQLIIEMESLTLYSGLQRVIGYLLQNQAEGDPGLIKAAVNLPVSKAVIAAHLNLTPETLSRILHNLDDEGLISMKGMTIHIHDIEQLRSFSG